MLPNYLLRETIAGSQNTGPAVDLGNPSGKLLVLTLGITRIVERETLEVSVWGSPDGENWGNKPLVSVPPKFYCGVYSVLLNLASRPDVRKLRVQWKVNHWGRGGTAPMFGFYVFVEESGSRLPRPAVANSRYAAAAVA
jgi:hypothetical protein